MYTVYVLRDDKGKFYKGFTSDLPRRLKEHISGHTKTTKNMKNLEVVYSEEYATLIEARKRELYFKSATGRRFIIRHLSSVGRATLL